MTRTHTLARAEAAIQPALADLAEAARSAASDTKRVQVSTNGHDALVPAEVAGAFGDVLSAFAERHGVVIGAMDEDLTTTGQAARMLGLSRMYVYRLVDDGVIPCHYAGTHRRITIRDLLEYAERRRAERRNALDELVQVSSDAGLYDDF